MLHKRIDLSLPELLQTTRSPFERKVVRNFIKHPKTFMDQDLQRHASFILDSSKIEFILLYELVEVLICYKCKYNV